MTVAGNLRNPSATVTDVKADIGAIQISFTNTSGWWPGIYEKVMDFVSNDLVVGLFKDKILSALAAGPVKGAFNTLVNGLLKQV
jgi:hypothetical protein